MWTAEDTALELAALERAALARVEARRRELQTGEDWYGLETANTNQPKKETVQ